MATKRFALLAAVLVVLVCAGTAEGSLLVQYWGREADGPSELRYAYRVVMEKDPPIMEFRVSTGDLDMHNYNDVVKPNGWNFGIAEDVSMSCYGGCTPIGGTGLLLRHTTLQSIRWWTDDAKFALESFTFGFNHSGNPMDASWRVVDDKQGTFVEDSVAPVGGGDGPAHAPMTPEPAMLGLLGVSGIALLRKKRG